MRSKARNCLTQEKKKLILANHEECKSYSEITGIVRKSKSVVYSVIRLTRHLNQNQELASLRWLPNGKIGWLLKCLRDRFDTATSISRAFCEQTRKPIFRKTVSPKLNKEKLVTRIPYRKPFISQKNPKVRLDFTTEHIMWKEEPWIMAHFRDESKFNLFGTDAKSFIRRKNGEHLSRQCVKKTGKFGGDVMAWWIIFSAEVGFILFHGNINASIY